MTEETGLRSTDDTFLQLMEAEHQNVGEMAAVVARLDALADRLTGPGGELPLDLSAPNRTDVIGAIADAYEKRELMIHRMVLALDRIDRGAGAVE